MADMYCEYKGIKYKIKKRDGEFLITSTEKKEGFLNYIDIVGNEHTDLFMKHVTYEDIDILYEESILISYRGNYFELFGGKVFREDVQDNTYMIWTNSEQIAKEYDFEKKEQFVFVKYITREEIESVKIIKKPVLICKDMEPREEILVGKVLDEWLKSII